MRGADEPIGDEELEGLFGEIRAHDLLVLAVSGGADSMALMHLVARWREHVAGGAGEVLVATVDHGLRAASAEEARFVMHAAMALGLRHETLLWQAAKPTRAVQKTAREARYRLLAELANHAGARRPAVVTAHHRDDQAETLLMRLARGSGLDGLAAMAPVSRIERGSGVVLRRPLLGIAKARLVATLRARSISWLEDPSNELTAFERVRLRQAGALLAELGLDNEHLALSATRLRRARTALELAAGALLADTADLHAGAYASIDRSRFDLAPDELRLRVLACLVAATGGTAPPPRLSELEHLLERLGDGAVTRGITLGGCIITATASAASIFREPGRGGIATLDLRPGEEAEWDDRFRVGLARRAPAALEVRALGADASATLRTRLALGCVMPSRAAQTLPSFWHKGELVAVPHLSRFEPGLAGPLVEGEAACRVAALPIRSSGRGWDYERGGVN
jgi:tRNA(Ile)-lysidine synthase